MRIAMISERASPLGVADLSKALVDSGHEVRVYTRRTDPDAAEVVTVADGVRVLHVPAGPARPLPAEELLPYMGEFARLLGEYWQRDGWTPDVLHAHSWTSGLAAVTAAKQINIPVVQSFYELGAIEPHRPGPSRTGYERALGRAVDRVVAQSHDEMLGLVRIGVPRAQLTVVPGGVDSDRFSPDGPAVPRDPDRPRILSVGRLVERKGFGDVIQAMRYVPGAEVVVVGGPPADQLPADPCARSLRALAERLQVADRFRLVGSVPHRDMPSWYRSADLLVAAPWQEEFERSALEAMACGVPIIGTAVGGLTETVVDGLTGDLVPARDPHALGGAVRRLINDKVRRFTYATAALDRARQAYSWKRVAAQVGSVYSAVTGLRRSNTEPETVV
ncbi:glycosyltransferase [Actinoplanes regularis]|uniref:Glycosyltransferase involved in cell wall bisynthesis n=1 Tax=Actinoplanes regularis TaxID=52697 RepID=A0A239EJ50_9ACTN|nr:glycosyltransferase [Actinoplanes regularis]GIE89106.1 glycosyl transferase [Actinoplanes regularis]GLW34767.1 glycosyl transferase [Actinoplanes regularis]SNS44599.1 Glycosyltransferase involved in cell wall bisynthesis [Actinoplanes regularis]